MPFIKPVSILVLASLSLVACQSDVSTMTLDQALEIRSEFSKLPVVSAPRNIDRLRRYFDEGKPVPDDCVAQRNERHSRLLKSLKAVQDETNNYKKNRMAASLVADAERLMSNGEFDKTIELLNRLMITLLDRDLGVRRAIAFSLLARLYAQLGDLDAAESARARFELTYGLAKKPIVNVDPDWTSKVRNVLRHSIGGEIALAKNELVLAEYHYKEAINIWKGLVGAIYVDVNKLGAKLAQVLFLQGRFVEAEAAARSTIQLLAEQNSGLSNLLIYSYSGEFAESFISLAASMLAQGRTADAAYLARMAINMHEVGCSEPTSLGITYARRILIDALAESNEWGEVIELVEAARVDFADKPEIYNSVFLSAMPYLEAELRAGSPQKSLNLARSLIASEKAAEDQMINTFARSVEAISLGFLGSAETATEKFAEIFPELARIDGSINGAVVEGRRVRFLEDYFDLLIDSNGATTGSNLNVDTSLETLKVSSALKLSRVGKAITQSVLRNAAVDPELSQLVRQEQDIAQNIRVLSQRLAFITSSPDYSTASISAAGFKAKLGELNQARKVLLENIFEKFPEFGEISSPLPLSNSEVTELLAENQTLLVYHIGTSESYLWSISKGQGVKFFRLPIGYRELDEKVALLRQAVDPGQLDSLADIPEYNFALAYELYQIFLEPVADSIDRRQEILIVPDGPLSFIPFSMLVSQPYAYEGDERIRFDGYAMAEWVGKKYTLSTMPTLESLRVQKYRNSSELNFPRPFVGFGDPVYYLPDTATSGGSGSASVANRGTGSEKPLPVNVAELRGLKLLSSDRLAMTTTADSSPKDLSKILEYLPQLPDTRDEILAIADTLESRHEDSVFLGVDASESQLYDMDLSETRYLAFATHGLIDSDHLGLNGPALALTHPFHLPGSSNDGLLQLDEIYGLSLNTDMVVLSACNTASADRSGEEAVSGLGRAFFYAGSRSLLVSHWGVHSRATTELMSNVFALLSQDGSFSRSQALTEAMMNLANEGVYRQNGVPLFSYAHPIFWAPFSLVGYGS